MALGKDREVQTAGQAFCYSFEENQFSHHSKCSWHTGLKGTHERRDFLQKAVPLKHWPKTKLLKRFPRPFCVKKNRTSVKKASEITAWGSSDLWLTQLFKKPFGLGMWIENFKNFFLLNGYSKTWPDGYTGLQLETSLPPTPGVDAFHFALWNHSGAWMHSHFIRTGFWNNFIFHNTCLCRCGLLPFFHLFYPGHVRICFLNEEDHWGNFRPKSRSFSTNKSPGLCGHWPDQASRPAGMPTCFDFTSYELNGGTLLSWATWEVSRLWASTEYFMHFHVFLLIKQWSMALNSEWE